MLFLCEKYQEPSAAAKIKQGDAVRQLLREKKNSRNKIATPYLETEEKLQLTLQLYLISKQFSKYHSTMWSSQNIYNFMCPTTTEGG